VTEKNHDYLDGRKTTVFTDNNPLTYVLISAKLDSTGHRWIAALSYFVLEICYRPDRNNSDADGLSGLSDTKETNKPGTSIIIPDSTLQLQSSTE
jgi:hypothetical protein